MYGIRQKIIQDEPEDVPEETNDAWMEQICVLIKVCEPQNIWNIDENGVFFQALPNKWLVDTKIKKLKEGNYKIWGWVLTFKSVQMEEKCTI